MDSLNGREDVETEDTLDYESIDAPAHVMDNERRLHVRAYNHWASLIGDRALPSIEDLNPEELTDFAPNSVLLDFSMGIEDPAILYLGSALRDECGIEGRVERTSEVPPRSLVSRLTDHYLQIIANAAPIGFEAEFTNQRGVEILYRGILMPFSSDDETIDFIYGVISWKEVASAAMMDALGAEIASVLATPTTAPPLATPSAWDETTLDALNDGEQENMRNGEISLDDFGFDDERDEPQSATIIALPITPSQAPADEVVELVEDADDDFDILDLAGFESDDEALSLPDMEAAALLPEQPETSLSAVAQPDLPTLTDILDPAEVTGDLGQVLDLARQSALEARESDARSRAALYRAIGYAYDFALSAQIAASEYQAMLDHAGIVVQDRAPMTAVIKLIFGCDYDKTRIAEYAAALDYAMHERLPQGAFARHLAFYQGGLKGLIRDIREARHGGEIRPNRRMEGARRRLLRAKPLAIETLDVDSDGLAVVVVRREADGTLTLVAGMSTEHKAAQQVMIGVTRNRRRTA